MAVRLTSLMHINHHKHTYTHTAAHTSMHIHQSLYHWAVNNGAESLCSEYWAAESSEGESRVTEKKRRRKQRRVPATIRAPPTEQRHQRSTTALQWISIQWTHLAFGRFVKTLPTKRTTCHVSGFIFKTRSLHEQSAPVILHNNRRKTSVIYCVVHVNHWN